MSKNVIIGVLTTIVVMLGVFTTLLLTDTISLNKKSGQETKELNEKEDKPEKTETKKEAENSNKQETEELPAVITIEELKQLISNKNEMKKLPINVSKDIIKTNFKDLDLSQGGHKIIVNCSTYIDDTPDEFDKTNYCPEYTVVLDDKITFTGGEYNECCCSSGTTIYTYNEYIIEVHLLDGCIGSYEIRVYKNKQKIYENKSVCDAPDINFKEFLNNGKLYFLADDKDEPNSRKTVLTVLDLKENKTQTIKVKGLYHADLNN